MREPLVLRLEQLSYYQHLSLTGGKNNPIFAHRIVDIRGLRFHVLSRIQDSGLDFTGRTNFVAHHLVVSVEEIQQCPTPPIILRDWDGWVTSWAGEPRFLEDEDWSALQALCSETAVPARTWQQITGDAVNGYGLLEARAGAAFWAGDQSDETTLSLLAESVELLEVRDPRREFRSASWEYTFTTSLQEQDNPGDFRWRCLRADNPAASRLAGPACRPFSEVRASRWTGEETEFARLGRRPPGIVLEPKDAFITEGEAARFEAKVQGIPNPFCQWYAVDKAGNATIVAGQNGAALVVENPQIGISRYVVSASNSAGEATSRVATLSVERKLRLAESKPGVRRNAGIGDAMPHQRSEEEIESQRQRIRAKEAQRAREGRRRRIAVLGTCLAVAVAAAVGVWTWRIAGRKPRFANAASGNEAMHTPSAQPRNTNNPIDSVVLQAEATQPLPRGWKAANIGTVRNGHHDYFKEPGRSPCFLLNAKADGFREGGDNVLFVYRTNGVQPFGGSIRTNGATPSTRWGIMARESAEAGSPFLFVGVSAERVLVLCRNSKGLLVTEPGQRLRERGVRLNFLHQQGRIAPSYSFDGSEWYFGTNTIPIKTPMLVGLAAASESTAEGLVARFEDVHPLEAVPNDGENVGK